MISHADLQVDKHSFIWNIFVLKSEHFRDIFERRVRVYGQALGDKLLESVQYKETYQFLRLTRREDLKKKIDKNNVLSNGISLF